MKQRSFWAANILLAIIASVFISWKTGLPGLVENKKENVSASVKNDTEVRKQALHSYISGIYANANLAAQGLDLSLFEKAVTGYMNLKNTGKLSAEKSILSIVDFSKPSTSKRLWIVDLARQSVIFNTFVAHGQGSGDNVARNFSNTPDSHQSSLGFYVTSDIYYGKHGRSMKLDGMDEGFNSNARSRAIVVHGADYVSQNFINAKGRLGRSHGCPAVPVELTNKIIDTIVGKTCLFINADEPGFKSAYLNPEVAMDYIAAIPQQL